MHTFNSCNSTVKSCSSFRSRWDSCFCASCCARSSFSASMSCQHRPANVALVRAPHWEIPSLRSVFDSLARVRGQTLMLCSAWLGWPHLREPVLLLVDNFHCFFFLLLHALERRLLLVQPYLQTPPKLKPATSAADRIAGVCPVPSPPPRYGTRKRRGTDSSRVTRHHAALAAGAFAWSERALLSSSSRYTCASFDERIQFQLRVVPKPSLLILASSASASAISDDLRSTYTVQHTRPRAIM
jgi:hypothetical protein